MQEKRMKDMRIAVFSDVHGNLESLKAVLERIKEKNADMTLFLGDIFQRGHEEIDCLELLKDSEIMPNSYRMLTLHEKNGFTDYSLFNFFCTNSKNRDICSPSAKPWCTVMDTGIVLSSPIFPMTQRG